MAMKTNYIKIVVLGLATMLTLNSCRETIDEGARFTFVGNTVATYLQSEKRCKSFVEILTRGECIGLMKAYGTYTCFAPTDDAIKRFLVEQDSIYRASVAAGDTIVKGINSPNHSVSDLSKEKCVEIARNHIIAKVYSGIDFKGDLIPDANINDRDLTLGRDTINDKYYVLINKQARVVQEEEVENGVVHIVEGVVNPSVDPMPTLLGEYEYFTIFSQALDSTGYARALLDYEDETYTEGDRSTKSMDESTQIPYPANKRFGFTLFLVTDAVLKEKYGIDSFDALVEKCKEWYKPGTQAWIYDDKGNKWNPVEVNDDVKYTDPRHPLNQFIGYHLLDRKLSYEYLVFHNIKAGSSYDSENDFPGNADRTEYYVTMNNRILKVTKPLSERDYTIYLNYSSKARGKNLLGQNIKVYRPSNFVDSDPAYKNYNSEALNGSLNVIDNVLVYDEDVMAGNALNCIMRIDMAAICPELTNNKIRWKFLHNKNSQGDVYIPQGYCKNVKIYSDNTRLYYLPPHSEWGDYQGDELMAKGVFDLAYRLPPLPEGTYEIRLGYTANTLRGIVQVYLDDEPTGIPIDLTMLGDNAKIGWKPDVDPDDPNNEEDITTDQDMYNRGFLKGPKSFSNFSSKSGDLARSDKGILRAVIAKKLLASDVEHWIRFKDVYYQKAGQGEFMHDYIEIVPEDYLISLDVTEDEKRY